MTPEGMSYAKFCPDVEDEDARTPELQTVCKRFLQGKCRSRACKYLHPQSQDDEGNESDTESHEGQYLLNRLQESLQVPNHVGQGDAFYFNFPGTSMIQEMKVDAAEASNASTYSTDIESDEFWSGSETGRRADRLDTLAVARLQLYILDQLQITEKNTFIHIEGPPAFSFMRRSRSVPASMKSCMKTEAQRFE
eukprot:TRINITY_DN33351_c0_g1_i1.p1 TRINITY_DN33351_c0_g1~~TRINITY_DN33351_c0_g1_i1.p1  ORF type:complete len:215 (-),score=40.81 TRINITY_DN33351_c0_g1_i1:46-627(-)